MSNGNPPHNHTVLVPRPGASSPGAVGAAAQPQAAAQPAAPNTPPRNDAATQFASAAQGIRTSATSMTNAALTLLSLMATLQSTASHNNVPQLHKHITQEIKGFENAAIEAGEDSKQVLAARYLLCSALDEIVLNTPWGAQSGWSQHSLLSLFHKETSGGEKVFAILQKMLAAPGENLNVLELFFHCFSLGFMGKYRIHPNGVAELEKIQDNLYATLRNLRPSVDQDLSPHWQTSRADKPGLSSHIPLWVIGCFSLVLLVIVFSGFRFWLHESSEPVVNLLESQIAPISSTEKRE